MRLSDAIGTLSELEISAMARRVVAGADQYPAGMWPVSIENVLRTSGHVEQSILVMRPPVLAVLLTLTEQANFCMSASEVREQALVQSRRWRQLVSSGELVGDERRHGLYRRLLVGAWGIDLRIDASETALLGLLRKELGMSQAEHFLVAHHSEVITLFGTEDDSWAEVVKSLLHAGVIFAFREQLLLPEELVLHVRRAIGVSMRRDAAKRLLSFVGNDELREALAESGLRSGGSKSERIDKLVEALVPIESVLNRAHIQEVKDIARRSGASVTGSKEELISRVVRHFDLDADLKAQEEAPVVPPEPRQLARNEFGRLFELFTGHQLKQMLIELGEPHSGAKDKQIESLWQSRFCEVSILRRLTSGELVEALAALGGDTRGTKDERLARIIALHRAEVERMGSEADRGSS